MLWQAELQLSGYRGAHAEEVEHVAGLAKAVAGRLVCREDYESLRVTRSDDQLAADVTVSAPTAEAADRACRTPLAAALDEVLRDEHGGFGDFAWSLGVANLRRADRER